MLGLNLKDYFSITKLLMLGVFITSCSKEGNNICRNTNSEYADMIEQIYEDALNSGYSEEMDECVRHYINYENPTSINYRSEIKFRITENDNEIISLEILGSVGPQDADSELMISGNTFKM